MERLGRGGVHHVAFRVPTGEEHAHGSDRLEAGLRTNSGLVDRYYFQSIYFREPNGILFELATDGPGFTADEDAAHLGEGLALPPFLEPHRAHRGPPASAGASRPLTPAIINKPTGATGHAPVAPVRIHMW